ncbi:hypothetical protein CMO86_03930 [Candidatus Woesearchaeota archaeon]|mgnify:FL=1|jgi:hypothetical protein|nr:hypothetical protein [Candidatus Woesearchaeota archaeon]|tara:strand:- start:78 stop:542 length:465 start_codon:yes stop_codon:yes gene_type:complete
MASSTKASIKSSLRQSHANYFDNLMDSVTTLADGGVLAAGSVAGIGIQAVTAAGANQSNGGSIDAAGGTLVNVTGADNTKCVVLPLLSAVTVGTMFLIFNNAASNTLEVFGGVGDAIGPAGDDTAITIAADTIMLCIALDGTQWVGAELPVIGA